MRLAIVCTLLLPTVLIGCGANNPAAPTALQGASLKGIVHGGQSPVVGAKIYLFAAATTAYGAASHSLLTAAAGNMDGSGNYYTESGPGGNFDLTGLYTCTSGQEVYVYGAGGNPQYDLNGNPVSGNNAAISLMAVLGDCSAGNFSAISYIELNELSTVAAAYALAGFATDPLHVSDDEAVVGNTTATQAQVGMATAFLNAASLVDLPTGTALSSNPSGGMVPTTELNTLGDILAACVNTNGALTTGSGPTLVTQPCGTLFAAATSDGAPGGVQPADTATAMLNIAHNPGASAIVGLWSTPISQAPFQPTLAGSPKDFTVAILFNGPGYLFQYPVAIATDGAAGVYVSDPLYGLTSLSPTGNFLGGYALSGGGTGLAVDAADNVWVGTAGHFAAVIEYPGGPSSNTYHSYSGTGSSVIHVPQGIAIDADGTAWIANAGNTGAGNIVSITATAPTYTPMYDVYTPSGTDGPFGVAVDTFGDKWFTNPGSTNGDVTVLGPVDGTISPAGGYTDASIRTPAGVAIDANNNAWVGNSGNPGELTKIADPGTSAIINSYYGGQYSNNFGGVNGIAVDGASNIFDTLLGGAIFEVNDSGVAISSSPGYGDGMLFTPQGIAVDGSGDVWVADAGNSQVVEFIGVGVPVVTPIATALFHGKLGQRP